MLRPYDLLENVLIEIEKSIKNNITGETLAVKFTLSERHLRRLFKFAFNQSIAEYIRSRKLAASLEDLLNTDGNILDIALDYGYEYEQSFIMAFRREFGITPGNLRKTRNIVKIKPSLHLFNENKLPDGVLFGPDIVMVPQFAIVGKRYHITHSGTEPFSSDIAREFMENECKFINNAINTNVYFGFAKNVGIGYSEYMPSVEVENTNNIPQGFDIEIFKSSLCVRFRYIGQHHFYDLNHNTASAMFNSISKYFSSEYAKYTLNKEMIRFEKVDTKLYDGTYCQMEWFAPVLEKTIENNESPFLPPFYNS